MEKQRLGRVTKGEGPFATGAIVEIVRTFSDNGTYKHEVQSYSTYGDFNPNAMHYVYPHWRIEEPHEFDCENPSHEGERHSTFWSSITTGYGTDKDGHKNCYACCAKADMEEMRQTGKLVGYLTEEWNTEHTRVHYEFSNWPGSLSIRCKYYRTSKHAAYGGYVQRTDAWFEFQGFTWHAVNIGDSDIARAKRTKVKA